jgi:hypothetical protein
VTTTTGGPSPSPSPSSAAIPPLDDTATTLFTACEAAWEDDQRHDKFVKYCSVAGLLAPAARQYRRYLDQHPDDPIAARMQQRIVNMASLLLSTQRQAREPVTRSRGFLLAVGLAALAGIIGAILYGR